MTWDWRAASDQELWSLDADQRAGPAFGELFERHTDRIYAHCFHRTGSWSMAEDLTCVVFLEAWRRRREVRFSGDSVRPWLLAVANNATLNVQRTLRRTMLRRAGARSRVELVARCYAAGIMVAGTWPPAWSGSRCPAEPGNFRPPPGRVANGHLSPMRR